METPKITNYVLLALAIRMFTSCSNNDENTTETQVEKVEQPSALNKECSYVDGNWSATAVLSTTIGATTAETTFMNSQNAKIAAVWGRPSVTLRFVKDPSNPGSTYNAISYGCR